MDSTKHSAMHGPGRARSTEPARPKRNATCVTTVSRNLSGTRTVWPRQVWQRLWTSKAVSSIRWLLRPWVLCAFGVLAIAVVAVGAHFYQVLSGQIDLRLSSGAIDNAVGIYSGPLTISVGDRLPVETLVNRFRAAGYIQQQPGDLPRSSRVFAVSGGVIDVEPGASSGLRAIQLQVGDDGRVIRIIDRRTGEMRGSAAVHGKLLSSIRGSDRSRRITVHFEDIPDNLKNAVLAIEDRRFFSHPGVDWRGVVRAAWADIHSGQIVQGGSTLTQQLIKNAFFSPERSLSRKLKEAAMALVLETRLSKNDIFTLYCNDVYLGQAGTYAINGFAEAAQSYFGKGLGELTLSESAFLAGLLNAPNRYLLMRDPGPGIARRNQVLDAMVSTGAISLEQSRAANSALLKIKEKQIDEDEGATYFLDYVQRYMDAGEGSNQPFEGQINTTLDPCLQTAAFNSVTRGCARLDKVLGRNPSDEPVQTALVAINARTGEVLAMMGGRSYDQSQLNRATDALRQPGSAFKPMVYAAALQSGYTLASTISDRPTTFLYDGGASSYAPNDFHGGFTNRDVTLREALAHSMNVPAVKLAEAVGLVKVAELAEKCGLPSPRTYPSMALGTSEASPLQLAAAYTAFANGGRAAHPVPLKYRVADGFSSGASSPATSASVFSPEVAYLMTSGMESVINSGTARKARSMGVEGAAAGKTGTTSRDGWFVGYTPGLVCAVWVGFDGDRKLGLTGAESALPIWADFIKQATSLRPELGGRNFRKPAGIVIADIDPTTGMLATPECPQHFKEVFVRGTDPFSECSHANPELVAAATESEYSDLSAGQQDKGEGRVDLNICAETGLLAGPTCPRVVKRTFEAGNEPLEHCRPEFH
ncbi:MAG TPA: PBP1A family penicillin-binding protein [Blastocatellia bacterium]|nr:PBP1A family penicillin-binding protein [Blastocatellia bacterium]